jgi:tellurium resistance protein TerD
MADDRVRIIFDEDGYPRELIGEADREKAIRTGSLTPETSVILYRTGAAPVATRARDVAELRVLFGDLPAEPEPPSPRPPPSPPPALPAERPEPTAAREPAAPPEGKPSTPQISARPAPLMRGANISLSRAAPGMRHVMIDVGWDEASARKHNLELDLMVFIQNARGKVRGDDDVVFYNNKTGAEGAVRLCDDPSGFPSSDAQAVAIELDALGSEVGRITFAVAIYDGAKRNQNFAMVAGAYIRVVNPSDYAELARCDILREGRTETAIVFGEIYNRAGEWKFKAVDQGYAGGLAALASAFGVDVAGEA